MAANSPSIATPSSRHREFRDVNNILPAPRLEKEEKKRSLMVYLDANKDHLFDADGKRRRGALQQLYGKSSFGLARSAF